MGNNDGETSGCGHRGGLIVSIGVVGMLAMTMNLTEQPKLVLMKLGVQEVQCIRI